MKKKSPTAWQGISIETYPSYFGHQETEVVVVGAGIAGTTIAYMLAKAGKHVLVIDESSLYRSVTAYTTAFITRSLDTDLATLQNIFGKKALKQILGSHEAAIDTIENIINTEGIACDFERVPNYMVAFTDDGLKRFKKEAELSLQNGFDAQLIPPKTFPFKNKGSLLIPNQAKFHPLKYVAALREKAIGYGAKFFDQSKARYIEDGMPATVLLEKGTITATSVVVATYNPISQPWWYVLKKGMYVSFIYEVEIAKGTLPYGLYEDDDNPYHYFRVEKGPDADHMIIGGEDHRIEIPIDYELSYSALRRFIEKKLGIKDYKIIRKWSGPILEQTDGLALIGLESDNRYIATAFSGNGMTYGTLAGLIISDQILGKENLWEDLYDPSRRIRLRAVVLKGKDYAEEFIGGMIETIAAIKKTDEKL